MFVEGKLAKKLPNKYTLEIMAERWWSKQVSGLRLEDMEEADRNSCNCMGFIKW